MSRVLTTSTWRNGMKAMMPAFLGTLAAVAGFILMRISALYESWLLLFVSLVLMIWGIMTLFTGDWRPRGEHVSSDRSG